MNIITSFQQTHLFTCQIVFPGRRQGAGASQESNLLKTMVEEPAEEPQVDDPEVEENALRFDEMHAADDPEVEDAALRFDEMPADLVGAKKGAKKGARPGRKPGTIGRIVEPRTIYASINRSDGTARLFNDNKVGRVAVVQTYFHSPPKTGQEMMHCVVGYADGTYRLFRVWENIMPISRRLNKRIKTLYTVLG
eukprot:g3829.t1